MELDLNAKTAEQQRVAAKWHYDNQQLSEIRSLVSRLETIGVITIFASTIAGMMLGIAVGKNDDGMLQVITASVGAAFGFLVSFAVFTKQRLFAVSTRFICEKLAGR